MIQTNVGSTQAGLCDCTIAWLYKDAHKFGLDKYIKLVGNDGYNIYCDEGPVLRTEDVEFIKRMNACSGNNCRWSLKLIIRIKTLIQ